MPSAYVDSSTIVSIAFNEEGSSRTRQRLGDFNFLVSSNLLEAEVRAAFARENRTFNPSILVGIEWHYPDRPLTQEIDTALTAGYLRGADLWHVAAALYIHPEPSEITFLTPDNRQRAVAAALGFRV